MLAWRIWCFKYSFQCCVVHVNSDWVLVRVRMEMGNSPYYSKLLQFGDTVVMLRGWQRATGVGHRMLLTSSQVERVWLQYLILASVSREEVKRRIRKDTNFGRFSLFQHSWRLFSDVKIRSILYCKAVFTTLLPTSSTETSLLTSTHIRRSVSPAFAWKIWMFPNMDVSSSVQENASILPSRLTQSQHHSLDARVFGRQEGHLSDSLEDSRGIRQTLWKTAGAFVRHPKFMTTLLPASSTETLLLTSACIWRSVSPAHACEGCMLRGGCSSSIERRL